MFRPPFSVSAKVWLPEPLDDRLKDLAERCSDNRSESIRNALFKHVYGSYCFEQMRNQHEGYFWEPPKINSKLSEVMFSRSGATPYDLGKNIVNVRVWLPPKLRDDLALLASNVGKTWSFYVREALIFHFMGQRLLLETDTALGAACEQPDDEADDRESRGEDGK